VDQESEGMTETVATPRSTARGKEQPILEAEGLVKLFGRVVGLRGVDLRLFPGEVLAVIGDNGAGKSTLIKCLSGALTPDRGSLRLEGRPVSFKSTQEARAAGIETVYQTLAVAPALDIASNLYLAREIRRKGFAGSVLRMLDMRAMREHAAEHIKSLGISTLQNINQAVETLSGGQRQIVAVARTGAFGSKIAILDEPTAALGVRETAQVLRLIRDLRDKGLGVILISHNMPNVFETADRIHVQRLGGRAAVISPQTHSMQDAVAIMTGAMTVPEEEQALR
jgi:fructose transport system ATP-binding protein